MHDEIDERCTRTRELLAHAEERELSPAENAEKETHLKECEDCRSAASWLALADQLARSAPAPEELADARLELLVSAVMDRVAEEPPLLRSSRRRRWALAPAFASLAALVVVAFVLLRSPETPELLPQSSPPIADLESRDASETVDEVEELGATGSRGQTDPVEGKAEFDGERKEEAELDAQADAPDAPVARRQMAQARTPAEAAPEPEANGKAAPSPASERDSDSAKLAKRELMQATGESAGDAAGRLNDETALWEQLGEVNPGNAAQADSLRERLSLRLEDETDPEQRAILSAALEELERRWPQAPDSD